MKVEDDMKQRLDNLLRKLFRTWKTYMTPVLFIGTIMVIASIFLIAIPNDIWRASGTAMLAAGLTIITTTLTNKESIRQQFAKEANIIRKDTVYGPVFIELKIILDWLDDAKNKEGRYPLYIYGAGGEPASVGYLRNTEYPTFLQWPQFKQDYRIDNFTPGTRLLLDETQQLLVEYNVAMGNAMNPAIDVLARHIRKPVANWMRSESFHGWDKKSSGGQQPQPEQFDRWNSNLKLLATTTASNNSNIYTELARMWLGIYKGLGWLVADERERAIASIREGYTSQSSDFITPDNDWFLSILNEVCPKLDDLQEMKEARLTADRLHVKIRGVKNLLESGVRLIRDQYEGGEPPI